MRKIDIYALVEDPELFSITLKFTIHYFILSILTTAILFFVPVDVTQYFPPGEYIIPVLNSYHGIILENAGERYFSRLVLIYNKDFLLLAIVTAVYAYRMLKQIKSGDFRYFFKFDKSFFCIYGCNRIIWSIYHWLFFRSH